MLEGKNYRALVRVFPFVVAFITLSTEHRRTSVMTRVHTRYGEIVSDVMGDIRQRAWSEEDLSSLERTLREFKGMMIELVYEPCDSASLALKYRLPNHMM